MTNKTLGGVRTRLALSVALVVSVSLFVTSATCQWRQQDSSDSPPPIGRQVTAIVAQQHQVSNWSSLAGQPPARGPISKREAAELLLQPASAPPGRPQQQQQQQLTAAQLQSQSQWRAGTQLRRSLELAPSGAGSSSAKETAVVCADRLCYGLPKGCFERSQSAAPAAAAGETSPNTNSRCSVLVTSKHLIDPYRPVARDIHFELVALPAAGHSNYAAVGFSSSGRMAGLVSECLQYRDANTKLQIIKLAHSYNVPGAYSNVPVTILSGIRNLGVSFENGYYQCRWVVESAVEFTYEEPSGQLVNRREDLGYKNYHILLASGAYNERTNAKSIHSDRASSIAPISLAQTGHIKSLGSHILIRIHGSLMVAIWFGLVTISVFIARYYKNEWPNSKINDTAIWFVAHRALMLVAWFASIVAAIFAYMYTETYHPGVHQISGTTCLVLSTIQVLGGLLRPSLESTKRTYFNWAHFVCGNLAYLCAMISIVTAAFLAPAHLPPIYIWVVVAFVAIYALTHLLMTIHQYVVHRSSKISITPMSDLNDPTNTFSSCGFVADSYPKEVNSTFRQVMLGILVTIIVVFIVLIISLVNIK